MSIVTTLKQQATPPSPLAGRLATQSLLFALGEGTFMAGSAVFFTQIRESLPVSFSYSINDRAYTQF